MAHIQGRKSRRYMCDSDLQNINVIYLHSALFQAKLGLFTALKCEVNTAY